MMTFLKPYQPPVRSRGFTLIELLVVITILGILASLILGNISEARAVARDTTRIQEAKQFQTALEVYRNNNGGFYPCGAIVGGTLNCVQATSPSDGTSGGANSIYLKRREGTAYNATETLFRGVNGVNFAPQNDALPSIPYTIVYRLASLAGASTNAPDRTSYTILVWQEMRTGGAGWCKIVQGTVNGTWASNTTYPYCF